MQHVLCVKAARNNVCVAFDRDAFARIAQLVNKAGYVAIIGQLARGAVYVDGNHSVS